MIASSVGRAKAHACAVPTVFNLVTMVGTLIGRAFARPGGFAHPTADPAMPRPDIGLSSLIGTNISGRKDLLYYRYASFSLRENVW
jgi:hypothetical protein